MAIVKRTSREANSRETEEPAQNGTALRPPNWLVRVVEALIPPGLEAGNSMIGALWEKHGSLAGVLPHLPAAIAWHTLSRARDAFYWNIAMAQAVILFIPFVDILSLPLVITLGLVLAVLIILEGYIRTHDRPYCEAITTFMTPALIILFNGALGFAFPELMIPEMAIVPRAFKLAVPITLCRYLHRFLFGRDPGAGHPHRDLLRLGVRTWFFNSVWLAGALVVISTNVQAVPPIFPLQEVLTSFLTAHTFSLGWRCQLNPLDGISRHRRILVTLNSDPYLDDLKRRRGYLLTGADWFGGFNAIALFEMLFFALLALPLLIGLAELYFGHPGAAGINGLQMAVNGSGWVALIVAWKYLKKLNRQTAAPFDKRIQEVREKARLGSLLRVSQDLQR